MRVKDAQYCKTPAQRAPSLAPVPFENTIIPLDSNWEFKQANDAASPFRPVAQFPTNVHLDLLAHNLIPDPFIGKNETGVQWVGEVPWVYKTTFETPELPKRNAAKAVLAFDGLDTFATVYLNGNEILKTDNMFIPLRVDVIDCLKSEGSNELEITFESAYLKGCEMLKKYPDHQWGCWNGDTSRLAVRKAQYHWGWDWGPKLMTCGPWKPISLEVYKSRISDLYFRTELDDSLESAKVLVVADVEGDVKEVGFEIISHDGEKIASEKVRTLDGHALHRFSIKKPALWNPVRYGKQPLYTLRACLDGNPSSTRSKRLGIRKVELVQEPLIAQPGTSFFFKINNIPIFCGGSNWIPADSFLPRVSRGKYHDWVQLAADGNQNMLRVWGGGIYEDEAFYDACDELGILVWQDFLFACGNYPAYPSFLKSVKQEAEANLKFLRHHPCIVLLAGNNEDYQYQESSGLTYDRDESNPKNWLRTDFPARYIYEKLLPDICIDLVPDIPNHFGSPWGGKNTRDPTVGDIHQWDVWHGAQRRHQDFDELIGRFVSEFGMEAFPNIQTIESFLPKEKDDPDRYVGSSTLDFHNKATGHTKILAHYLSENLRYSTESLESYIYATQLMQAECLSTAYRLWKRQWKGPGREYCSGALVWQLNDCWPVISWSIADYELRPKPAYFAMKRELESLTIGMKRVEHILQSTPHSEHTKKESKVEIWACNLKMEDVRADVVVKIFEIVSGKELYSKTILDDAHLLANRSTEISTMDVTVQCKRNEEEVVMAAFLFQDGVQVARTVNWPDPLRYMHVQKPKELRVKIRHCGKMVDVLAEVPVKGVLLECGNEEVKFEDNLVDLVPGEVVGIGVKGLEKAKEVEIKVRYYGMNFL